MNAPFIPAVASAMPPASGAPTRCADEAGAAGNHWYETPGALSIILAIGAATTLCEQLERTAELGGVPYSVREAADQIGKVERRVRLEFDRWNRGGHLAEVILPTNGACAVSSLLDGLKELREQALLSKLRAKGVPIYFEMHPAADGADKARRAYERADSKMPTVEAALQAMGVGL